MGFCERPKSGGGNQGKGRSERERERGVWIKRKERGSVPSAVDDDDD